jgi:hypothetical protein
MSENTTTSSLVHIVVAVAFSTDASGNHIITSNFIINAGSSQLRTWTIPAGYGTFDASDWDPNGHLHVFPKMDMNMLRASKPGNLFYVAVHNEVK